MTGETNERSKIKVCVCKAVCGAAGGVSERRASSALRRPPSVRAGVVHSASTCGDDRVHKEGLGSAPTLTHSLTQRRVEPTAQGPAPCTYGSTHLLTHSPTYSLTRSLGSSLPHSLAHLLTHSVTRSLGHSVTHSVRSSGSGIVEK